MVFKIPFNRSEIAGEHVIFTIPRNCARNIDDVIDVLKFWDKAVERHHKLRGSNPKDYRRERMAADVQTVCGWMHSGYPIMTHIDVTQKSYHYYIFNLKTLGDSSINWGLFVITCKNTCSF